MSTTINIPRSYSLGQSEYPSLSDPRTTVATMFYFISIGDYSRAISIATKMNSYFGNFDADTQPPFYFHQESGISIGDPTTESLLSFLWASYAASSALNIMPGYSGVIALEEGFTNGYDAIDSILVDFGGRRLVSFDGVATVEMQLVFILYLRQLPEGIETPPQISPKYLANEIETSFHSNFIVGNDIVSYIDTDTGFKNTSSPNSLDLIFGILMFAPKPVNKNLVDNLLENYLSDGMITLRKRGFEINPTPRYDLTLLAHKALSLTGFESPLKNSYDKIVLMRGSDLSLPQAPNVPKNVYKFPEGFDEIVSENKSTFTSALSFICSVNDRYFLRKFVPNILDGSVLDSSENSPEDGVLVLNSNTDNPDNNTKIFDNK